MWFLLNIAATIWWLTVWNGAWDNDSITAAFAIGATALIGVVSELVEKKPNAVLSGAATDSTTECDASPRPPRTRG